MSRKKKVGKSFFQIVIVFIILLLFFVDLDYLEDKCTFLRTFKLNVNWFEHLIESYTSLFIFIVVVAFIIWAMFTLSISVKGVSVAGFEITLKDTDKAVKNNIRNYLNTKRSLFYIKAEYDNFCEVFDSYHGIYDFLRNQLLEFEDKKKTSSMYYFEIQTMLKELNRFLTVHQSDYRRWFAFYEKKEEDSFVSLGEFQKKYPQFNILMHDFVELNKTMRKHAESFDIDVLNWEYEKITNECERKENTE